MGADLAPFEAQLRTARLYTDVAEVLMVATGRERCSPAGDLWRETDTGHVEPLHRLLPRARAEALESLTLQGFASFLAGCEVAQVRARGWRPVWGATRGAAMVLWHLPGVADSMVCTLARAAAICRAEVLREELESIPGAPGRLDRPALVVDGYDQRPHEGEGERQGKGVDASAGDPADEPAPFAFAQAPAPSDDEPPHLAQARRPTTRALHHGGSVTPSLPGGECA